MQNQENPKRPLLHTFPNGARSAYRVGFRNEFHTWEIKGTPEWCMAAVNKLYYNSGMLCLSHGKDLDKLFKYANGKQDMFKFRAMFKSEKKSYDEQYGNNGFDNSTANTKFREDYYSNIYQPLPLLPQKVDAAVNQLTENGIEYEIRAIDDVAKIKTDADIEYLRTNKQRKAIKQEINDQLGLGVAKTEGTQHSANKYTSVPLDLDLEDDDQVKILKENIYRLAPEVAYESACDHFFKIQKLAELDRQQARDHVIYGCSATRVIRGGITRMVDIQNISPDCVFVPRSKSMDFRDAEAIYITHRMSALDLMNNFPDEIKSVNDLYDIYINGKGGYVQSNSSLRGKSYLQKDMPTASVEVVEFQVKTMEWVYTSTLTGCACNYDYEGDKEASYTQVTYKFYWLKGTKHILGIQKLGFAYRSDGQEIYTSFDVHLTKSSTVSIVERCIGECESAQIAYIKMIHAVIKAAPSGKYIDIKLLKNAAMNLVDGDINQFKAKMYELLSMAIEENIHIGDSDGIEGGEQGNYKATQDIVGGLKQDVLGYLQIIQNAQINIGKWTGINDDISGTNNDSRTLNFARKANIAQGMVSLAHLSYCREDWAKFVVNLMTYYIKLSIEEKGKGYEYIKKVIGEEKTKAIDDIVQHTFFVDVTLGQRDFERQQNFQTMQEMSAKGYINPMDKLIITTTRNPKDQALQLAIIYQKAVKKEKAMILQQQEHQQRLADTNAKAIIGKQQVENQGDLEKVNLQNKGMAYIQQLKSELGMSDKELEYYLREQMNQKRSNDKTASKIAEMEKQAEIEVSKPIGV